MGVKDRIGRIHSLLKGFATGSRGRRDDELRLVRASALFDRDWYLREYPDVQASGIDPLLHYMDRGWHEGRDPGPQFSSSAYLRTNADVARSGSNPLVHFIEFGYSEGREAFGHRPRPEDAPTRSFDFPAAAPCFSMTALRTDVPEWVRHHPLRGGRSSSRANGDETGGSAPNVAASGSIEVPFERLRQISGYGEQSPTPAKPSLPRAAERLVDAWYANSALLRTRWGGEDHPFVIRAYQADPIAGGAIDLIAEGLVSSPLDVFDLQLRNPYFPVLLVFAAPDGTNRGTRMLAFPSLCRGGVHYPELLYSCRGADHLCDPLAFGERLAGCLGELFAAQSRPAVTGISVDLSGADGARPLFQSDFQIWLEKVARVPVLPCGGGDGLPSYPYLADAVTTAAGIGRTGDGAQLVLQHDMIPTLAVLTAPRGKSDGADEEVLLPVILAGGEPSQPAISFAFPNDFLPILDALSGPGAPTWPRLKVGRGDVRGQGLPPGAIRVNHIKKLTDAELYFPVGGPAAAGRTGQREAITWLIEGQHWDDNQLLMAMTAAAQQNGAEDDAIALIGPVARRTVESATQLFGARVRSFMDMSSAIAEVNTALSGYIGSGVILHDNECTTTLSRLASFDLVATASCVLLSVEPRGKAWHAAIADGGALTGQEGHSLTSRENVSAAQQLWRTVYPVAAPSPSFWIAKSSRLRSWIEGEVPQTGAQGLHLCSSVVTASLMTDGPAAKSLSFIPAAQADQVATTEVLFG